jgi:hypothetical protein
MQSRPELHFYVFLYLFLLKDKEPILKIWELRRMEGGLA